MEINTMTKQNVVCSDCKSDEIVLDAWAVWSTEQQEFILYETKDWTICKNCGGDEFEFIDISEEE